MARIKVLSSQTIGACGLPERCNHFELVVGVNDAVRVRCEYIPTHDQLAALGQLLLNDMISQTETEEG